MKLNHFKNGKLVSVIYMYVFLWDKDFFNYACIPMSMNFNDNQL